MLNEQVREVLSAFLDGQLGRRQRKAVLKLLQRSSEARSYLQQLQEGSLRLRQLPQKKLPTDFPQKVLRTITERGLRPAPATLPMRRTLPTWTRLAIAAAVLVAVGLGSIALYRQFGGPNDVGPIVKNEDPPPPAPLIGVSIAVAEFKQPQNKERLTEELKKQGSFRLDLSARNTTQAVSRMESVLLKNGIKLVRDRQVQAKLQEKKPKVSYLIYAENLQPEEVAAILQQLSDDDKSPTLQTAMLSPFSSTQRGELSKVLGVPVEKLQAASKTDFELPMLIHDPVEKSTKGSPAPAQAPQPERLAVVLAYTPGSVGGAAPSPEVARALANRPQARPGTLQLVVVLREGSA